MARRYVSDLADQESVDSIFRANNKQLRPNRNGDLYLSVELSDRTGGLSGLLWNADEKIYRRFENGDFVRVNGTTQLYQGSMQMILSRISRAEETEVDTADFYPLDTADVDQLLVKLRELFKAVTNPHLSALVESFLSDEDFMRKFRLAPAGIKHHHAYHGGLLEHVVNMMDVARRIAPCYPMLDLDQLLLGCFLHDLGKLEELEFERGFAYTDEGQMLGHVLIGVRMLEEKIREAEQLLDEPFPAELAMRLKHLVVSHHGDYEFGSPKLPMTLEALALTYLDNLDAKLHAFEKLMKEDPNVDSPWTLYQQNLGRKIYKGAR